VLQEIYPFGTWSSGSGEGRLWPSKSQQSAQRPGGDELARWNISEWEYQGIENNERPDMTKEDQEFSGKRLIWEGCGSEGEAFLEVRLGV
jgi:hypothetical protein